MMDIFHVVYLACANRLTVWLILYHLKPGHVTTSKLISICWQLFKAYSTADEHSIDSSHLSPPTYSKNSLRCGVWSADYLQLDTLNTGYWQAELVVKITKRIVNGNPGPQGSLDNDNVAWAILQYWNTPIQGIGLSLAQLLLHRLPYKSILYKPHPQMGSNGTTPWINPPPLQCQNSRNVAIQSLLNCQWNTTGKIITILTDRQYQIRINASGRITHRNHHFLRKCKIEFTPTPILSASPVPITSTSNAWLLHPSPQHLLVMTCVAIELPKQTMHTSPHLWSLKISQALFRVPPHNKPGLKERHSPHTTQSTCGVWRGGGEM